MKQLFFILTLLPVLGFSQSGDPNINSSAMKGIDFKQYHSFGWLPFVDSIMTNEFDKQQLDQLITANIDNEMQSRGLKKDSLNPDLYVRYAIMLARQQGTVQEPVYGRPDVGVGFGFGRGGFSGAGISVSSPQVVGTESRTVMCKHSALVIEVIDIKSQQVVWRGSADKTKEDNGELVNPKLVIEDIVPKIFKKFPIKKSK